MYSYGMILTGYNEKSFLLHAQFITLDQIFSGWTLAIICLNKVRITVQTSNNPARSMAKLQRYLQFLFVGMIREWMMWKITGLLNTRAFKPAYNYYFQWLKSLNMTLVTTKPVDSEYILSSNRLKLIPPKSQGYQVNFASFYWIFHTFS